LFSVLQSIHHGTIKTGAISDIGDTGPETLAFLPERLQFVLHSKYIPIVITPSGSHSLASIKSSSDGYSA